MSHTEYKNKSDIRKILFSEKNLYDNSYDGEVIYYNNYFVKGKSYSYLNAINSIEGQKTIRPLINREFENLENIYPGMGACFLDIVMKNLTNLEMVSINEKINVLIKEVKNKSKNFHKKDLDNFIETDINEKSKTLVETIVKNCNPTTKIYLDKSYIEETIIVKTDSITFDLEFDSDFFITKDEWEARDYKFIIIDGFIESVGEIYHLLHEANENKEPHVIFCKGMSSEVKDVLIQNLIRNTINVFPVSLDINELNVNILADIAKCHNSGVISSQLGDTISAAVRRELKRGKEIKISKNAITIKPQLNESLINTHIRYLEKKISKSEIEINTETLKKRVRMLSSDKLVIKLGKFAIDNPDFLNDIKKSLFLLKNGSSGIYHPKDNVISQYFSTIPSMACLIMLEKIKSFLNIVNNVESAVIISNKKE